MKPKTKRKMIILAILIVVIFCWRKTYFWFTPEMMQRFEKTMYSELDSTMQLELKTRREKKQEYEASLSEEERREKWRADKMAYKERDSVTSNTPDFPCAVTPFLDVTERKNYLYGGYIFTYTSSEYGWERKFGNYYTDDGYIVYNQDYVMFWFVRGEKWRLLSDSPGSFFPAFEWNDCYIYSFLFFNTAKIGWEDIIIVDRKTGKTVEKFRTKVGTKAYLDDNNVLYIRRGTEVYSYQIR